MRKQAKKKSVKRPKPRTVGLWSQIVALSNIQPAYTGRIQHIGVAY